MTRRTEIFDMLEDAQLGGVEIFEELAAMERIARGWSERPMPMVPSEVQVMAGMLADMVVILEGLVKSVDSGRDR